MSKCCGKVTFRSELGAKMAAARVDSKDNFGDDMRVYRCPNGGWHLTHKRKKRNRGT